MAMASALAGTRLMSNFPPCSVPSSPPGTTVTLERSPPTSTRRCFWPTSAPPQARPSSRPTATLFRYGKWLWVHNGLVRDFHLVKRDLALAVDESLYPYIEGSADSETLFYLALTFGLEDDPPAAVAKMVGFVEDVGHRHGVEHPIQMTIGTSDGKSLWAFRYSSERDSRTLFYSTDVRTVRRLHPDLALLQNVSDEARIIVSEPLGDLFGAWNEVPESSYVIVQDGDDEMRPFRPIYSGNGV